METKNLKKPRPMTESQKRDARKRYLLCCIAIAELNLESQDYGAIESAVDDDEIGASSLAANTALLLGLLEIISDNSASSGLLFDDFVHDQGSRPVFEILDVANKTLMNYETVDPSVYPSVQLGMTAIGRVLALDPSTITGCNANRRFDPEIQEFPALSFIRETEDLVYHFYASIIDDLFCSADETEFQSIALSAMLEWSSFCPLRLAFILKVSERALSFSEDTDATKSARSVLEMAKTVTNLLNSELFPPLSAARTSQKKMRVSDKTSTDNDSPKLQYSRPFSTMKRGFRRKLISQLEEARDHLKTASIGRSISMPDFCTGLFEFEVALDIVIGNDV